jgi:hypothetical protein
MSTKLNNLVMDVSEHRNSSRSNKRKNSRDDGGRKQELKGYNMLQQQRIKEKELLKQWKMARGSEKKTRSIVRSQSRDVCSINKLQFSEHDDEDGSVVERFVQKHDGCNAVCKADDCIWWNLEAGLYTC